MKFSSLLQFAWLLLANLGFAQVYQPTSLSDFEAPVRSGTRYTVAINYGTGTFSPPTVLLHYSGTQPFGVSGFATSSRVAVSIGFPAPLAGAYRLDAIEFQDAGGNTRYNRDGTITRALYAPSSSLPTTHNLPLARGDFAIAGAAPVNPETGRATNLSTRGTAGTGDNALIVGIAVSSGTRSFLIRAIGPTLGSFGVPGALRSVRLELKNAAGTTLAANERWPAELSAVAQGVGAFPLTVGSSDAALKATLPAGSYTLVITSTDGSTGVALAEAYELP